MKRKRGGGERERKIEERIDVKIEDLIARINAPADGDG